MKWSDIEPYSCKSYGALLVDAHNESVGPGGIIIEMDDKDEDASDQGSLMAMGCKLLLNNFLN